VDDIERIDPVQAHAEVTRGNALLVCAYDSDEKFRNNQLEGALSLQDLQRIEGDLPRDREIIFYCA
jgi:rhodanese-related sulfurtransferase